RSRKMPRPKASVAPKQNAAASRAIRGRSYVRTTPSAVRTAVVWSEIRDAAPSSNTTSSQDRRDTTSLPVDRLARGRPLFLLDGALALDAVAGEGERLQPLLGDGFSATLAVAEAPLVHLLQGGDNLLEQSPIAIAQLE